MDTTPGPSGRRQVQNTNVLRGTCEKLLLVIAQNHNNITLDLLEMFANM